MELFKEGKFDVIQHEFYAADCESIEPAGSAGEITHKCKRYRCYKRKR